MGVSAAKLLAAKKNITGDRPRDSCEKASVFRQPRDADAAFAAEPKNERATGHLPIADEAFNGMNGQAQANLVVNLDQFGLAIAVNVSALRGDMQGVEKFSHEFALRTDRC